MFALRSLLMMFALIASCTYAAVIPGGPAGNLHRRQDPLPEVITHCKVPGTAALTFDDGPWIALRQISDILTAADAKGTFFFNGNNWGCIYEPDMVSAVKYAFDAGHQMASHTWNHYHLNTLNQYQLEQQFWLVEEAIQRITGRYPTMTRPPFGEYNDLVRQVAAARNQLLVNWDHDTFDTAGASGAQSLSEFARLAAAKPESILSLAHEIVPSTVEILPQVIRNLQAAGYRLVTVAECLEEEPYMYEPREPEQRHAGWDANCSLR